MYENEVPYVGLSTWGCSTSLNTTSHKRDVLIKLYSVFDLFSFDFTDSYLQSIYCH